MPIDPSAVGARSAPVLSRWSSKDALLYALGVGAGAAAPLEELAFTTENTHGVPQQVLPTMVVVIGRESSSVMSSVGTYDPAMLVHGEQAVTVHGPLPVEGEVEVTGEVTGIFDKGKGAVVEVTSTAVDPGSGAVVFTRVMSAFIRGEGGFGGERGPSVPRFRPDGDPDHVVVEATRPDQALLYRLSGDRNPLHSDPAFARAGGFDRPILHGLCTYGFAGRAVLRALCGSDPARFGSMSGRFTSPVTPGEGLRTEMWETGRGEAAFRTTAVADGRTVIDGGRVALTPGSAP